MLEYHITYFKVYFQLSEIFIISFAKTFFKFLKHNILRMTIKFQKIFYIVVWLHKVLFIYLRVP